jgi:hypothetical protein
MLYSLSYGARPPKWSALEVRRGLFGLPGPPGRQWRPSWLRPYFHDGGMSFGVAVMKGESKMDPSV